MEFNIYDYINSKELDRYYNRLDPYQKNYYNCLYARDDLNLICVNSPAGTGKTTIAVMAALEKLREGNISKIYYIRFPDDRSLRLGYLPGDEEDKTSSYTKPFFDACEEFGLDKLRINNMCEFGLIELCTDISMRGTNISDAMVIIDEAQNARFTDLKLVLTRIKDNCKVALIGHSGQTDNFKGEEEHAFEKYVEHMCKQPWAIKCDLPKNYRGKLSTWADKLELDEEPKQQQQTTPPVIILHDRDEWWNRDPKTWFMFPKPSC